MRILVTGRGGAASWTIRGEQIGAALGAVVKPNASLADMRAADVILVVKRVPPELLANLHRSGRPWVYDIVDAYPQPESASWTEKEAIAWLANHVNRLGPTSVIWPTARMQADGGGAGTVVYHHHRPGIEVNPIYSEIRTIGYDGRPDYLQGLEGAIAASCKCIGADFVPAPRRLADVDVVLALRGPRWSGYPTRHWKSNVKLANAHGSGTPFIGAPECGYEETSTGWEYWAENGKQLDTALAWLASKGARDEVSRRFLARAISVEAAAAKTMEALSCALKC